MTVRSRASSATHAESPQVAETALLDERRPLTRDEVLAVAALPLDELPDLVALAHRVRLAHCGPEVELESLINGKSGACPEDCAFCSQSAATRPTSTCTRSSTSTRSSRRRAATRDAGATQFCIVVAVRGPSERLLTKVIDAVDAVHPETGLEVACSLGLLTAEQAQRLAAAGVRRYNHNLETCREVFPSICTTHTYDDRVATARLAIDAGMELCCGGILGMGETLEQRVDFAFELAALEPCEVPINFLLPTGTPLGDQRLLTPREALQAIALFRLVLPSAWIRLAGGRERVLGELQAMGLLAGANALIVGQLPHHDGPSARGRSRAARRARHAGRRRPRRRPLRRRRATARTRVRRSRRASASRSRAE